MLPVIAASHLHSGSIHKSCISAFRSLYSRRLLQLWNQSLYLLELSVVIWEQPVCAIIHRVRPCSVDFLGGGFFTNVIGAVIWSKIKNKLKLLGWLFVVRGCVPRLFHVTTKVVIMPSLRYLWRVTLSKPTILTINWAWPYWYQRYQY